MFTYLVSRVTVVCLLCITLFSCKKNEPLTGTANLTIVNAVRGAGDMVANFNGTTPLEYYVRAPILQYNTFTYYQNRFNSNSGPQRIGIYRLPDTTDKSKPVLLCNIDLPVASINTLLLLGTITQPDMLLLRDQVPYIPVTDSVGGFRFVNALANSGPVSVNIKDRATGSLVSSITYKNASDFIMLPVKPGIVSYNFEFRDVASGALIFSYTTPFMDLYKPGDVNFYMWRSNTLVLTGDRNLTGTEGPAVVRINNY